MNAIVTLIPFILTRTIIFRLTNPAAYKRAQEFVPLEEGQKIYYILHQVCQLLLLVVPIFYQIAFDDIFHILGIVFYIGGLLMVRLAILSFTETNQPRLFREGIYRISRHPMYVGYYLLYLGIGLWMHSIIYLIILFVFAGATHQIILAEEKWCIKEFGDSYLNYMKRVHRYI